MPTGRLKQAGTASCGAARAALTLTLLLLTCAAADARRQAPPPASRPPAGTRAAGARLPAPEKLVADYLKVVGGKKRLAAIKDATYTWSVQDTSAGEARARTLLKAPASSRTDLYTQAGEYNSAANPRAAWRRTPDGTVRTLTGVEAFTAKLQAMLSASRLSELKRLNVLASTVAVEQAEAEPAYVVEFSTREGGRVRCWFGATSKLLLRATDAARGLSVSYSEWRAEGGILEPHRAVEETAGRPAATLVLQSARYNTGLSDAAFDPPGDAALDIPALLRELAHNQAEDDQRVNDYTFLRKVTERKLNDRGEVTKETVNVYEIYPVAGWGLVQKLVSEQGAPLPPERAAKEEKRVAEELEKAAREAPKREQERQRKLAERRAKRAREARTDAERESDDEVGISTFLRAAEFVAPRRERFGERDTVVFDFRARPNFQPSTRAESVVAKLVGTVWIDPADKQVVRLEAHFAEGFKMGGGLLASIKPGSAFVFEQTRLPDGVWLPRLIQVNASARLFLFAGVSLNQTQEYSDYKRFSTRAGDAALDAPQPAKP